MRSQLRRLLAVGTLTLVPAWAAAQQTGTVSGRVIASGNQQPIAEAQITILGTTLGARTGADGMYRIGNVPVGTAQVRVARLGFGPQTRTVTVTAGEVATADFALAPAAVRLDEVVTTATGETQRRRETGNSVSTIPIDSVPLAVTGNFSEVLSSRVPGVEVHQSSGTVGTGSRIRIRGSNSVSLSNDPLLLIDGVRANNDPASLTGNLYVGNQQPSRFDDINPEDIENVEIIKGPAAAALYGTAAANGVIQITTKRGRAGKPRWTAHTEAGTLKQYTKFPGNYNAFGDFGTPDEPFIDGFCILDFQVAGICTPIQGANGRDSVTAYVPFKAASPFRTGNRQSTGASVAGGNDAVTYYVGGDYDWQQGIYEVNNQSKLNLRTNLRSQVTKTFDISVNAGYLTSRLRLPQNDNNILGVYGGGLLGGTQDCSPATPCGGDTVSRGYILGQPPQDLYAIATRQNLQRFTGGANSNWKILPWLSGVGTVGIDLSNRDDNETTPPGIVQFADLPLGNRTSDPYQFFTYTANAGLSATFDLFESLQTVTSGGAQYNQERTRGTHAFGRGLVAGTGTLPGTVSGFSVSEENLDNKTLGAYVQEQLRWRDRVFLTGALRRDKNSAFGADFGWVNYPSASLSWVVSEEPFFPQMGWLNSVRLRTAYGQSGQRPSFRDARSFFSAIAVSRGIGPNRTEEAGIMTGLEGLIGGTGNPDLRPEKSAEAEVGFEAAFFQQRLGFDFTYYNKTTTDALVQATIAPDVGGAAAQFINLGKATNKGWEALVTTTPLDIPAARWNVTFNTSHNINHLVTLGPNIAPIIFDPQRHEPGYPLGSYFVRPYTYSDKNGDGLISAVNCPGGVEGSPDFECEITVGDTAVFLGSPFPKFEGSLNTDVTFFNVLKVAATIDRRTGQKLFNNTERFRCAFTATCRAINDRTASLRDQARAAASTFLGSDAGYVEDASYTKLREVAVTLMAPKQWATRVGASDLSLTFAGRNLKTWTPYSGFDPEVNGDSQAFNYSTEDFLTQPPIKTYTVRLNVGF